MEEEGEVFFADLFDDAAGGAMIPAAPPLFAPNGVRFQIPPHIAASIVLGKDAPPQPHYNDAESDQLPGRFPVPLLRRNLSLSKNTPHALQGRLAELSADLIALDHAHQMRMLELDTAMKTERLTHSERCGRIERERALVEKALAVVENAERERERRDLAAATVAGTGAASLAAGPGAASSPAGRTATSVLLIPRSPGETSTGDESGCGVCLCADRDTLVAPCGHVAMCFACADAIRKSRNPECPFCRTKITAVYKLFVV